MLPVEVEEEIVDEPEPVSTVVPVAAPSVRRLARELGIDLRKVRGSEAGGRVVLADVRNYIQRLIASAGKGKSGGGAVAPAKPRCREH